ncbi:MAG TPA: amidohydrolase family protein [Solirubrobacteraceae bacterium]|nr:amidohydrolase family protein [Solirubrobacteraceae bacterium]
MKIDVHQHVWTEPLVHALASRSELPFVRRENGLTVLYIAGERPYVIDLDSEAPSRRAALVERDGLDSALVCLSSPVGIESLPRAQARPLIDAYHEGALSLAEPFAVWGAVALDGVRAEDVDASLARGCVGISLPAGALAGVQRLASLDEVLARLEAHDAPLLVHPGPAVEAGRAVGGGCASLDDPLWWPALTGYVASMQAAWLTFLAAGRLRHPRLRVVFSMLAGLAPLHAERLAARGGPSEPAADPLVFYETSSYGARGVRLMSELVGHRQILYGSDRPVVDPRDLGMPDGLAWEAVGECPTRAFATSRLSQPAVLA